MSLQSKIDRLSINARQCIAVICLERFCKKYNLKHSAIDNFINHIWKVTQLDSFPFTDWEQGFCIMPITGQGDPYPSELVATIPKDLLDTFDSLTQYVYETSAITWYGRDIEGTKKMLLKVIEIVTKHNILIPDIDFYTNEPIDKDGWGPSLSDEKQKSWRATV